MEAGESGVHSHAQLRVSSVLVRATGTSDSKASKHKQPQKENDRISVWAGEMALWVSVVPA